MLTKKHLSFTSLRKLLSGCFHGIEDGRQNSKVKYSIHDTMMSGFACMHFQEPSLLQFQIRLEKSWSRNNLRTLFGVHKIPEEATQMRRIIDEVDSEVMRPFFKEYTQRLQRAKYLEQYQMFPDLYICSLDGTQYFSSNSISCESCLRSKSKKQKGQECSEEEDSSSGEEIRFSHKVLQAAIMHPDCRQVIPLMPEEIRNDDGETKQDCETNAAKRILPKIKKAHPRLGLIICGDDLFSRQPMIQATKAEGMHYIFVAKPTSHKYLTEWLEAYPKLCSKCVVDEKKKIIHEYKWMNNVPLHGGEDALLVNYFSYSMKKIGKKGKEKITYRNDWVTDFEVTEKNVEDLVRAGRCRWKIENECFNTLKNQGYCIEHSYGHGERNLCFNFYLLTLLAFAFHQVAELTDKFYQECRRQCGSKRHLWETLRSYLKTFVFETWEALLSFTLDPERYIPAVRIELRE